jgi:NADPH2:quinone reductase
MRALQLAALDGPAALRLTELPEPTPGGDVLIDVHTAGVTFPDLLMTQGRYQVRFPVPFVPGVEVAGIVRHAPSGSGLVSGQRVAAFTGVGGFAEVAAAPSHQVVPIPAGVDFAVGAALMVNYQTAYFALFMRGRLKPGETVVVHGAAGGVGSAAVQVAAVAGARVLAVVSDEAKAVVARLAGATEVIVAGGDDWPSEVRRRTGGRGADVVFDPVGGERFDDSLRLLVPGGRALVIGFSGGQISRIPANHLLLKNIDAVGVGWGPFLTEDPGMPRAIAEALATWVERGDLRPVIGATYPLAEGSRALMDLAERRAVGKSLLKVR